MRRYPLWGFTVLLLCACARAAARGDGFSDPPLLDSALVAANAMADSLVRDHLERTRSAGAALVVLHRGRVIKSAAYGFAHVGTREAVTSHTAFFVASVTKVFTAAATLRLVHDGRLRLDARIVEYADGLPQAWHGITVRHLLTNTSGLPEPRMVHPSLSPPTYEAMLDSVRDRPLLAAPGTRWRYAGTNYHILGRIIERVSGQSFAQFVTTQLLHPAGVRSARFGDYREIRPGVAAWYTTLTVAADGQASEATRDTLRTIYEPYRYPSAGLHISALDLAQWVAAFAAGRVLPRHLADTIWAPVRVAGGSISPETMGAWRVSDTTAARWYFATGGARAAVAYWPDNDMVVAILTNTQGAMPERALPRVLQLYAAPLRAHGPPN